MIAAVVLASLCLLNSASGQTLGEYRSRQSGNWNAPGPNGTWEQWNGSAWVTENAVTSPGSVTISGDGYPVVASTNTSSKDNQGNTPAVISLPSGIQPGDLILIFYSDGSNSGNDPALPAEYTLFYSNESTSGGGSTANLYRAAWYKIANGTEGATVSTTNNIPDRSAHTTYRISGGTYLGFPVASTADTGTDDNPDPPSLTSGFGAVPTMWIATSHSAGDGTVTAPTNYTANLIVGHSGGTGNAHATTGTSHRFTTAASENPGQYDLAADRVHAAWTVAIQGIGVSGTYPNPVVVGAISGSQNSDASSHAISIPAGEEDDLLVVVFSVDGNPTVTVGSGTGWTQLGQQSNSTTVTGAIYYKMADGTDALTLSTSANEQSTHITYRIRGATGISGEAANAIGSNSNPPSHTASDASFLWIATRSGDDTDVASSPPSGYSGMITRAASGGNGASTNTAINILGTAATTVDPGTFASPNEQWVSWTLAIQGPEPVVTMVPIDFPTLGGSNFPVVAGTNTSSRTTQTSGQHVISLPSDIQVGDLLLIFWSDGTNSGTDPLLPNDYTLLYSTESENSYFAIWYKIADGTEGATVSTTNSFGERSAHVTYRIAAGTYIGIPYYNDNTGSSSSPNPPDFNPGQGVEKFLWIASAHANEASNVSSIPNDFENELNIRTSGSTSNDDEHAQMVTAQRFLEASSQDPTSFSFSQTVTWASLTLAIQGAPSSTIATVRSPHTVTVTADVTVDEVTIESGGTVVVNNGITFTTPEDGFFDVSGTLQMGTDGTATMAGDGDFSLNSGGTLGVTSTEGITASGATGNIQNTGTRTFSTGANYEYNGSAAQNTGNGLPATVNSLTIDNAAGVTLSADVSVTSTLDLTDGLLITGANSVTVSTAGSIANASASSYVNGNLCRGIAAGANTYAFPIGTAAAYAPVSMAFQAGTTAGTLCGSTTDGDHPDIAGSDVDAANSVNRFWSFEIESGLGTANYNATFNWAGADEDAGFDENSAIVGKYDNPNWTYPAIGSFTASSITITGESGFSDFQVGNPACQAITATLSGTATICTGGSAGLSVSIAGGTSPYTVIYSDGSNNFTVNSYVSMDAITVSPAVNTTYTLVSVTDDDGCPATVSGSATVSVVALPTANAGAPLTAFCQGGTSAALGGSIGGSATGGIWDDGGVGGVFNPAATDLNATWTPPASYSGTATLTLTTSGGPCAPATDSKTQVVHQRPSAGTCNQVDDLCQTSTGAIDLTASGGAAPYSVTWLPAHGMPTQPAAIANSGDIITISGLVGGTGYTFTITDSNGCIAQ